MPKCLLAVLLACYCLVGEASKTEAQEQEKVTEYDTRALRVESRGADRVVVRGRDGTVLGKINGLRGGLDLAAVVAPSPDAVREARDFSKTYRRGSWAVAAGLTAVSAGILVSRINDVDPAVSRSVDVVSVAGFVLAVYGAAQLNKAYTALAKSIWWHNRDLAR
jgi:hypothetical protein